MKRPVALIAAPVTADDIAAMFRALTGREPTPDDMRDVADLLRDNESERPERVQDDDDAPTAPEP